MEPIQIPLEVEIHPDVKARMDALELVQKQQEAVITHWRGVAMDAAEVAMNVQKAMKEQPSRGGAGVRNVMAIGGLVSVGVGCWWLVPAAALIVVGSISLGLVVFGAVARHKLEQERVRSDS